MLFVLSLLMLSRPYKVLHLTHTLLQYLVLDFGWNVIEGLATFMLTSHNQLHQLQFSESDQVSGEWNW